MSPKSLCIIWILALACSPDPERSFPPTRVYLLVDTSASMTWSYRPRRTCEFACDHLHVPLCLDSSQGCPESIPCAWDGICAPYTYGDGSLNHSGIDIDGNDIADDSRLFLIKEGLQRVLESIEELEGVEIGLVRFVQHEGPHIRIPTRSSSTYQRTLNYDGSQSCGQGVDVLVKAKPGPWTSIIRWIDHTEDAVYDPAGDRELRADGPTPLASAIKHLGHLLKDTKGRSAIIILGDGEESCDAWQAPLSAIKALHTRGIEVHVVSTHTEAEPRDMARKMAEVGGGQVLFPSSPTELEQGLNSLFRTLANPASESRFQR